MKVLKFGGSSVANPQRIESIIEIVKPRIASGELLTIVFSAFSGVTDQLIEMSEMASAGKDGYIALYHQLKDRHNETALTLLGEHEFSKIEAELNDNHETLRNLLKGINLVREISPRTLDYVLSFGERNSCFIIAAAMRKHGIDAEYLDARSIIKTNKDFGSAKVNFNATEPAIVAHYKQVQKKIQIVTGFIGSDVGGLTTTLGRGGSDYTAAILAGALQAEVLEIWTDVDGVLTCDPRKVKKAFTLPNLTYAEAMEMSHFGAKVIYPPTIQPALKKDIPIYIKNTFNPSFIGTLISKQSTIDFPTVIKGISSLDKVSILRLQGSGLLGVPGVSARLFGALGTSKINIVMISQASSEHSICIAVMDKDAKLAKSSIDEEFEKEIANNLVDPVIIESDLIIIAVVGEKMRKTPGVAGKLFESLGKNGVNIIAIAQGSSELNISFVIHKKDELKALNLLHDSFFLSDNRRINLFVLGVGLIGGTFLNQVEKQREELIRKFKLEINVVGLSNSKYMFFKEDGISLQHWKEELPHSGKQANASLFVDEMIGMNLSNSIFVDNTANHDIPNLYEKILENNISIVTPNKVATSASLDSYKKLKRIAADKNIHFKYETNVGAGLPIISTIQNLNNSGDKVLKIEAVVSGSLSFIFNNFTSEVLFSDLVKEAQKLGYTEPDPREDLCGQDVKRKAIILTREAGYDMESSDIVIEPILPQALMDCKTVEEFFAMLPQYDNYFKEKITQANTRGNVLRFIAQIEEHKATIGLQEVNIMSPFYALQGSDNIFVIQTNRYKDRPMIIRGPGAGADVTAAGVFADILTIFN